MKGRDDDRQPAVRRVRGPASPDAAEHETPPRARISWAGATPAARPPPERGPGVCWRLTTKSGRALCNAGRGFGGTEDHDRRHRRRAFGHTLGHRRLSAVPFFVPRTPWREAGVPSGYDIAEKLGYALANLSARRWASSTSASPTSGSPAALAFGYVYREADTPHAAALAFGGVSLHRIQAAMLAAFTIILMRGALLAVIALIATSFAAIWLLMAGPRVGGIMVRPA